MKAFQIHNSIIQDYKDYLNSFIQIKDERIKKKVEDAFQEGIFLPEPLIQFNPSFQISQSLKDLQKEGLVDSNLERIFGSYNLYHHQTEAIRKGAKGNSFVVTSGTGSGKSLTFLATIFNRILKSGDTKGVKAIIVYPMNALINSQEEEIKKYEINYLQSFIPSGARPNPDGKSLDEQIKELKTLSKEKFPITYGKYTGQEGGEKREQAKENQPNIILTNYMMLELIMTRNSEKWLRDTMSENLEFLVFDELHTYRGRQGADVSMLVRRIKSICSKPITSIGTSATMSTEGTAAQRKQAVAKVASQLFSHNFIPEDIIGEKLFTCTKGKLPTQDELSSSVNDLINSEAPVDLFIVNKLAVWLEQEIALATNENGDYERGKPLSLSSIVSRLMVVSGESKESCAGAILKLLEWTENLNIKGATESPRRSFLPYKIHQFISQTGNVYVTLEDRGSRKITLEAGRYIRKDNEDVPIYPVVFSRTSGFDFICVRKDYDYNKLKAREPDELPERITKESLKANKETKEPKRELTIKDFPDGYILLNYNDEEIWSDEYLDALPDSWFKKETVLDNYYEYRIPKKIYFDSDGKFSDDYKKELPYQGWFIPARLLFDPTSGIVYDIKTNELTKLMRLGNEGRSTATTITGFSIVKALHEGSIAVRNQKLLSFTDNRQDASLQTGHFNDFLMLGRLRSAIYHALKIAPENTLEIDSIASKVFPLLNLKEKDYARTFDAESEDNPNPKNVKAIREYIQLRILYDLKRGWRYNTPNLEQCGLLNVEYEGLKELSENDKVFLGDTLFEKLQPESIYNILSQILDFFRTSYAFSYYKLTDEKEELEERLKSALDPDKLWSLDQDEKIDTPYILCADPVGPTRRGLYIASIGPRSYLGKYLVRVFKQNNLPLVKGKELSEFINKLCNTLSAKHFLTKEKVINKRKEEITGYRLLIDKVQWKLGDGKFVKQDEVRTASIKSVEITPNQFFKSFYQQNFNEFKKTIIGREHTGQLSNDDRIEREELFRKGDISAMFCSPTMELGIDIADLNIVHMRNVPPNPANYAQRSGRAGRSGQAALVFTYCATGSPHDRNYFKHPAKMVAGSVAPPKIDLSNEELAKVHLNAFLLMQIGLKELKTSVIDVLQMDSISLPLKQDISDKIKSFISSFSIEAAQSFKRLVSSTPEISDSSWFTDEWILNQINGFEKRFDQALGRWRILFNRAQKQVAEARIVIDDPTIAGDNPLKWEAKNLERLGLKQIDLLSNQKKASFGSESEFYVYRYLAAEGFLPGYNFTRLPVRAFLGYRHLDKGEFISRPKFIALKEFGPNNLIYHNGGKFRINRMQITQADVLRNTIKVSKKTGYAFLNEEGKAVNNDPITNFELKGENVELFSNVLELSESDARPQERISSEEEERTSMGFDMDCFFSFAKGLQGKTQVTIREGNQPLLNVIYDQSARLLQINKKWRRAKDQNFNIGKVSGKWKSQKELENPDPNDPAVSVKLFATDTSDILYIQPIRELQLKEEGVISLAYCLKRAIERIFQAEESELGVWIMGEGEHKNILLFESAEGSLGILSEMVKSSGPLIEIFKEAYSLLHFDPATNTDLRPDLPKASYDDLLSYFNQRFHEKLDRFSVKEALERLIICTIDIPQGGRSYEEQCAYLLANYDVNSVLEKRFIEYLCKNGIALPSKLQYNIPGYYINADFVYQNENGPTFIFCDGSVHDINTVKDDHSHKRQLLTDAGYDIIVWHYKEPIEDLIERRKDIFRKIK